MRLEIDDAEVRVGVRYEMDSGEIGYYEVRAHHAVTDLVLTPEQDDVVRDAIWNDWDWRDG